MGWSWLQYCVDEWFQLWTNTHARKYFAKSQETNKVNVCTLRIAFSLVIKRALYNAGKPEADLDAYVQSAEEVAQSVLEKNVTAIKKETPYFCLVRDIANNLQAKLQPRFAPAFVASAFTTIACFNDARIQSTGSNLSQNIRTVMAPEIETLMIQSLDGTSSARFADTINDLRATISGLRLRF